MKSFIGRAPRRSPLLALALAILSLAALRCGGVAAPTAAPAPTLPEFLAAYADAACSREDRCAAVLGRASAAHPVCLANALAAADYSRFFFGTDYYGELELDYELGDEAARSACLAYLATSACTEPADAIDVACEGVLKVRHPKNEGERCATGSHASRSVPCGNGLVCAGAPCAVCVRPKTHDEPCKTADDCGGAYCTDGRCRAPTRPSLGQPCKPYECAANLMCVTGATGPVCTARASAGAECFFGSAAIPQRPYCQSGLGCDVAPGTEYGICRPLGSVGATCWRNPVAPQQPCDGWCIFPTPDSPTGTCGIPPVAPPEHTACIAYRDDSDLFCPQRMYNSAHAMKGQPIPACECVSTRPLGSPCTADEQCAGKITQFGARTARCKGAAVDAGAGDAGTGAGSGTCVAKLPAGAPCDAREACDSYECDARTMVCGAEPSSTCQ